MAEGEKRPRKGRYEVRINEKWCKACNICVSLCPSKVYEPVEGHPPRVVRPEDCTGCMLCVLHCPDFAIEITERVEEKAATS